MTKLYALTKETLGFYRQMVECGFNHDLAMAHLKELYEHNTAFYKDLLGIK